MASRAQLERLKVGQLVWVYYVRSNNPRPDLREVRESALTTLVNEDGMVIDWGISYVPIAAFDLDMIGVRLVADPDEDAALRALVAMGQGRQVLERFKL